MGGVGDERGNLPSGTVAFLLTDVEGSSRLWESAPAQAAAAIVRHRELIDEVIAVCGGTQPLEQGEGDSIVASFARATDALRAAAMAQRALAEEPWPEGAPIRVRMALHTGEAEPRDDGTYAGAVLNRCARLRALAHGGQVLVSDATRDMVVDQLEDGARLVDLGLHRLRDLSRPERVWQLVAPGLVADHPPLRSLDSVPNNLPAQLSSFIGRDGDVERAVALLGETRLLTLSGSGGCGKTRLAQRVAGEIIDRFSDGVWWVELASLTDGELVPDALTGVIGLRPSAERTAAEAVLDHLSGDRALLIMDNCEHLVAACAAFVDQLLRNCGEIVVMATSREPLGVEGEVTWRVPSLAVPPVAHVEPDALGQYDAVRLFIDRAVQARSNFSVDNTNAPHVAQICHRLDGIPLALELAAARSRTLPVERIAAELDDRFRLLSGGNRASLPRQQTLLASIDWSHDLLDPDERALLRRLGVFIGGFTLDAAEAVTAAPPLDRYSVLDVLTRLVDKSLVQLDDDTGGTARYRLLESIGHYALSRLEEAGEAPTTNDQHLAWAVRLAEELEPGATNAHADAFDVLELELPNLRAALERSITTGKSDEALGLVASLCFLWVQHGHYSEAQAWTERAIGTVTEPSWRSARARWAAAYMGFYEADLSGANSQALKALEEARSVGDLVTEARSLQTLGFSEILSDPAAARENFSAAVELARQAGDRWCEADAMQSLAWSYLIQSDLSSPEPLLEASAEMAEELDNDFQRSWHYIALGWIHAQRGEFETARHWLDRSIETSHRVGDPALELLASNCVVWLEITMGRLDAVAPIVDALTTQRREWGGFGQLLIPGFQAIATLATAPAECADSLLVLGRVAFEGGATVIGIAFMSVAARAALEAGDADAAAHAADLAAEADKLVGGQIGSATWYHLALAIVARLQGDLTAADQHGHDALAFQLDHGLRADLAETFETLGGIAIDADSPLEASRLLSAGDALRNELGQLRLPGAQKRFDADLDRARDALGSDHVAAWDEGAELGWEETAAYVRRARGERKRPSHGWDSLTPTELAVARHAAEGLTNPQIGERMFISRRTVQTHLSHIFAKVGITSRSELAAEATRRGLGT
jgi:predicted ATPase/class 3 adenylate cyclase/DNA-binding CsgD family transcriptional regulator